MRSIPERWKPPRRPATMSPGRIASLRSHSRNRSPAIGVCCLSTSTSSSVIGCQPLPLQRSLDFRGRTEIRRRSRPSYVDGSLLQPAPIHPLEPEVRNCLRSRYSACESAVVGSVASNPNRDAGCWESSPRCARARPRLPQLPAMQPGSRTRSWPWCRRPE